ncbi:outer membrane protein, multidrug efflux system [Janthinobacterium sp. TND4EL3]|uniref:efflux transporter outer membrane subunit n=1 Tax=Janthinobacterium sp. TND4EL3 TaxID=1907311 RepID=UPI0009570E03|nr:efflux transporter outer membrane subunit [Janthinobacterium sp. TND4EL3]SIR80695.1 outer membrane protein, multidrug efflux system [Janthinobacterium sp. TND4EL3]
MFIPSQKYIPNIATSVLMLVLLAGCSTQPAIAPLSTTAPPTWSINPSQKQDRKPIPTTAWWRDFGNAELTALVESALLANSDIRIAAARVAQARAIVGSTDADLSPQLGLNAGLRRGHDSSADPKTDLSHAGFRASWEPDFFGDKGLASLAAERDFEGAKLAHEAMQVAVAAEVMTTYFEAQSLAEREDVARDVVATLERQIEVAQRRFHAGQIGKLDIDRLTVELGLERATTTQLRGELDVRIRQLAVMLGEAKPRTNLTFPINTTTSAEMPTVSLPIELLERRPDVGGSARAVEAAIARLGVAKRDLYPHIALDWSGRKERLSTDGSSASPTTVVGYGISLSLPIFDGGRIRANIDIHEAKAQEAMLVYEKAMLNALADAETAMVQLSSAHATVSNLEQVQAAGADAAFRSERLFGAGLVDLNTVLDARRSYFKARDGLIQGVAAQRAAAVALRRAFAGKV